MRISDWSSDVCSSDLEGGAAKHDIAVAVANMPGFIERTIPIVEAAFPGARVLAFGRLGDGNVHFNVRPPIGENGPGWLDRHMDAVNRLVHDLVAAAGRSEERRVGEEWVSKCRSRWREG